MTHLFRIPAVRLLQVRGGSQWNQSHGDILHGHPEKWTRSTILDGSEKLAIVPTQETHFLEFAATVAVKDP